MSGSDVSRRTAINAGITLGITLTGVGLVAPATARRALAADSTSQDGKGASAAKEPALDATLTIGELTMSYPSTWAATPSDDGTSYDFKAPDGASVQLSRADAPLDLTDAGAVRLALYDVLDAPLAAQDATCLRGPVVRADHDGYADASAAYRREQGDTVSTGKGFALLDGTSLFSLVAMVPQDAADLDAVMGAVEGMWAGKAIAAPTQDATSQAAPADAFDPASFLDPGYEALARTPDDYLGKRVYVGGKVLQATEDSKGYMLRVATDYAFDDVVMVAVPKDAVEGTRILEDDLVDCYGTSTGIYTYKSVLGASISVPSLYAERVILQG